VPTEKGTVPGVLQVGGGGGGGVHVTVTATLALEPPLSLYVNVSRPAPPELQ